MNNFEIISVNDIPNINIGQFEDWEGATGVTVFLSGNPNGMPAGLSIRGGGPAARESQLLNPLAAAKTVHAIAFAGGSAYGLRTSEGIMSYLEDNDIGFDVGVAKVPLVCQSDLVDLTVLTAKKRPDQLMGYIACENAMKKNYKDGNYGAGCGATVGKLKGMEYCMKSGIGSYAVKMGDLIVGAVVAVNALGDIFDYKTGKKIAGLLSEDKKSFRSSTEVMFESYKPIENQFVGNMTLGIVITNAKFDKTQLCKLAEMAQNGYARSIDPVHTSADGDSIYAVSVGDVSADLDMIGTLSAQVVSEAIIKAVKSAKTAFGYPAYDDFKAI